MKHNVKIFAMDSTKPQEANEFAIVLNNCVAKSTTTKCERWVEISVIFDGNIDFVMYTFVFHIYYSFCLQVNFRELQFVNEVYAHKQLGMFL